MIVNHRLRSAYGLVLTGEPPSIAIPTAADAALAFARRVDREADALLLEGKFVQAERLSHLALEARCRASGERA